jgi:hypothetical protein
VQLTYQSGGVVINRFFQEYKYKSKALLLSEYLCTYFYLTKMLRLFVHSFLCLTFQGCKQSFSRAKEEFMQLSNVDSPSCSNSITSQNQMGPQTMEAAESPISRQISDYEDTESVYLKRNSVQQIISEQAPDTTLSLRCSSLWMDS